MIRRVTQRGGEGAAVVTQVAAHDFPFDKLVQAEVAVNQRAVVFGGGGDFGRYLDFQIGTADFFIVFGGFFGIFQRNFKLAAGGDELVGIDELAAVFTRELPRLLLDDFLNIAAYALLYRGIAAGKGLLVGIFAARAEGGSRQR